MVEQFLYCSRLKPRYWQIKPDPVTRECLTIILMFCRWRHELQLEFSRNQTFNTRTDNRFPKPYYNLETFSEYVAGNTVSASDTYVMP